MAENVYAKVLLYAYPRLSGWAEATAARVENMAVLSYRSRENPLAMMEKTMREIGKRFALLEAKEILDGVLSELTTDELYMLEYKYFRRKKMLEGKFANYSLQGSSRNYFRRQSALLSKINAILVKRGYTEEVFFRSFANNRSMMHAYRIIASGKEHSALGNRSRYPLQFTPRRQKSEFSSRL